LKVIIKFFTENREVGLKTAEVSAASEEEAIRIFLQRVGSEPVWIVSVKGKK